MADQTIKIDLEVYKRILQFKKLYKIPIRYIVELGLDKLEATYGKKSSK